jgi:transposase InsO family protein
MIRMLSEHYPITRICGALQSARSSYYYALAPQEESELKEAIEAIVTEFPTYGYRRVTWPLRRRGWAVNPKRVARLMRRMGLLGKAPKKVCRTTDSRHGYPRYPHWVRDLPIVRPDQVWVSDITYVRLATECVYLAVIMEVFTRGIRGWQLPRSLEEALTLTALKRALAHEGPPEIHHSDQGVQYAATAYTALLASLGVQISMAKIGCPEQNGYAERLMRTIKEEAIALCEYIDFADALERIGPFLDEVYRHKRIHSALGYLTPAEFEQQWKESLPRKRPEGGYPRPGRPKIVDPRATVEVISDHDLPMNPISKQRRTQS